MREKIIQIIIFKKALDIKVICRMRTQDVNTQEAEHWKWKSKKLSNELGGSFPPFSPQLRLTGALTFKLPSISISSSSR